MGNDLYFKELERQSPGPLIKSSKEDMLLKVELLIQKSGLNNADKKHYEKMFKNIIEKYY